MDPLHWKKPIKSFFANLYFGMNENSWFLIIKKFARTGFLVVSGAGEIYFPDPGSGSPVFYGQRNWKIHRQEKSRICFFVKCNSVLGFKLYEDFPSSRSPQPPRDWREKQAVCGPFFPTIRFANIIQLNDESGTGVSVTKFPDLFFGFSLARSGPDSIQ